MPPNSDNGWDEWRMFIANELKRLNEACRETNNKLDKLTIDFSVLKGKAAIFGLIGGAVITLIIHLVVRYL